MRITLGKLNRPETLVLTRVRAHSHARMSNNTNRGSFVFYLPYPVIRGVVPVLQSTYEAGEVHRINELLQEWSDARWKMAERVQMWQINFLEAVGGAPPYDAEHFAVELHEIYEIYVLPVLRTWLEIARFVGARSAGALRCKHEFVVEWFLASEGALHVVQTAHGQHQQAQLSQIASTTTTTRQQRPIVAESLKMHVDPAWLFETVCIKHLQCACLQVLAFLKGVESDIDEAEQFSRLALDVNADLLDAVLPCYATSSGLNGSNSSFLASRHFHAAYVAAHLRAQNDQIAAIKCMGGVSVLDTLYGAAWLQRSCKFLADASTTLYDRAGENYARVTHYSRCCAHFMLASAFWRAYENDLALEMDETRAALFAHVDVTGGEPVPIDNQWLVINAFYCIRSTVAQLVSPQMVMVEMYDRIARTLAEHYSVMTPPLPTTHTANMVCEGDFVNVRCCISDDVASARVTIGHPKTKYVDNAQIKTYTVCMPTEMLAQQQR